MIPPVVETRMGVPATVSSSTCSEVGLRLQLLADGELADAAEQSALRAHVACCARCRVGWDRLQAGRRLLRAAARRWGESERLPPGVLAGLLGRIAADLAGARLRWRVVAAVAVVTGVALVAVVSRG